MLILEEQTGLNAGLNKGLKISKMLKKNVRLRNVSIKNVVKVGKAIAPIATTAMSLVPGGSVAGKIINSKVAKVVSKVKNTKVGKLATKVAKSKIGKAAFNQVVKPAIQNSPLVKSQIQAVEPVPVMPNSTPTPAQVETIAEVKGVPAESISTGIEAGDTVPNEAQLETLSNVKDIPVDNLKEEAQTQKETAQIESGITAVDKPNYTIPIVLGVGVVGAILLVTNSKK